MRRAKPSVRKPKEEDYPRLRTRIDRIELSLEHGVLVRFQEAQHERGTQSPFLLLQRQESGFGGVFPNRR